MIGLVRVSVEDWGASLDVPITQEYIEKLYEFLPQQMAALIQSKGTPTNY